MLKDPEPNAVGLALIASLKEDFGKLEERLWAVRGHGNGARELALARTNLEQASMWATKAVRNAYPVGGG